MAALTVAEFRNIVLLGRTGRGKSSTGNSILGSNVFESKRGAAAVTMKCELHSCTGTDGMIINVVDTPGLFDPELSNKDTISEISKVLEIMPDHVIHCALIVLNGDDVRFTAEEQCAMRLLRLLFGAKFLEFSIFVFTRGDCFQEVGSFEKEVLDPLCLEEEDIQLQTEENTPKIVGGAKSLRQWLRSAGCRYVLFNNNSNPKDQNDKLFNMMDLNLSRISSNYIKNSSKLTTPPINIDDKPVNIMNNSDAIEAPQHQVGYFLEDFLDHSKTLSEAQKQALQNPLTPEKQAEAAKVLAGQVGGLKNEIVGLKTILQQMSTDQSATLMQIVAKMRESSNPNPVV